MASIVISGDTSGSITLSAPAVSGSSVLTLPAVTDTVAGIAATQTLTNKTLTTPNINSAQVDTVSGTAPLYFCRAWVNFNGTGTPAIRASGNVSSITDIGVGEYTVNFTTVMPDANYSTQICSTASTSNLGFNRLSLAQTITTSVRVVHYENDVLRDTDLLTAAIFR